MWRKMIFLISLALLLVLANSASAKLWTGEGDGTSWYDPANWDTGVPGPMDRVDMNDVSPHRGPIINEDVECGQVHHAYGGTDPDTDIDMLSGTWKINGEWRWCQGSGNPRSVVTISGGNVIVGGEFRWADSGTSFGILNVSGGHITTPRIKIGDDGGGELNITNGGSVTVTGSEFQSNGSKPTTITIDDGLLKVIPKCVLAGRTTINLDSGTIEVGLFDPDGTTWVMDINEGIFVTDGNGADANTIKDYVTAENITAYDGAVGSEVHVDYNDVSKKITVWASTIYTWARNPDPENRAADLCPDSVVLSWTPGVLTATTNGHDVYFGTDYGDVSSATTSTPDVYKGRQTASTYDAGAIESPQPDRTYYWRIDQVDKDNPAVIYPAKRIWQFTTNDGNAFDPAPAHNEKRVEPVITLTWSPGCWATSSKVFFGTSYAQVQSMTDPSAIRGLGSESYDPGTLELETDYYWRVDSAGEQTYKGEVWKFTVRSRIVDENMRVWYEFEQTAGPSASDSSGYDNHGSITGAGEGEWEPNDGYFGGALRFPTDNSYTMSVPSDVLAAISSAVTVAVWVSPDEDMDATDDEALFDAGDLGENGNYKMTARLPNGSGSVTWRAGNRTNDVMTWKDGDPVSWVGEWHHLAFLKDETAGVMKIYFDGFVADSNNVVDITISNIKGKPFALGSHNHQNAGWYGLVDDFRVYDKALTDKQVQALYRGGDLGQAWRPLPPDGAKDVLRDEILTWQPGDYADRHRIFFGTDWDDVNDMTDPCALNLLGDETYDPTLELGRTYYWRVDEVNDTNARTWKGKVWTFTAADFLLIEDFESYDPMTNLLNETWLEGARSLPYPPWFEFVNGATVILGISYADPPDPVHRGKQSMIFIYGNDGWDGMIPYYSESERIFDAPQDWTQEDVKVLTLFFYGDPNNDANATEQMYAMVEDADSNTAINYGHYPDEDMNDIKEAEWQEWNMALADFTGVDMNAVTKMYIGFGIRDGNVPGGAGIVYFDNVRLYMSKCIPSRRSPDLVKLDLSDNCIIDLGDVRVMADDWLEIDEFITAVAPNTPTGRYEFAQNLNDSSGNNRHGTVADGTVLYSPDGKSGYCIDFDETFGVEIPGAVFADVNEQVTITLWINGYDDQNDVTNVILQAGEGTPPYVADWNDIIRIQTNWLEGDLTFEAGGEDETWGSAPDEAWAGEWNHYAFVADVNKDYIRIYHNARQVEEGEMGNGMAGINHAFIGIAPETDEEGWHDQYIGKLDDFRVYDYALSRNEIAHVITGGTTLYVPIVSKANLYDDEVAGSKVINFRDLAVIAENWLYKEFWP
ncbi:MAG: LamG domain-containing protein [Planctomycetota bacterium]|jgi:hypothetical protein